MNIGDLIEKRDEIKESISEKMKVIEENRDELSLLEIDIHKKMKEMGVDKISVNGQTAWIKCDINPRVKSWDDLYSFIIKENRFDLLTKTIKKSTFKEFVDSGKLVPGTELEPIEKLSFRKN